MKRKLIYSYILMIITLLSGCTVYENPEPYFEDSDKIASPNQRKVLLISIDGLVGQELQKEVPANLAKLIEKSKYTFNSLSDVESNAASTWTTMMTGVASSVHHVEDDSFKAKANSNDQHAAIAFTPSFFYRLYFTRPEYNTVAISSWNNLVNNLLIETETQVISSSDLESKNAAVKQLQEQDPEIMVVSFQDVSKAGVEGGFTRDNADYNTAINTIDGYVGDIMTALAARKDYEKEEWIVIITSNNGGSPDGSSGSDSFQDRNTFTCLYYKDFTKQEINPALIASTNFTQFAGASASYVANVVEATDAGQYNFTGEEMSVEFKFKRNARYSWTSQPFIIGKTSRWNHGSSGRGWGVATEDNKLKLYLTFDDDVKYEYAFSANIDDFKWHHFAFAFKKISNKAVQVTLFTDGVTSQSVTINTTGSVNGTMTSTAPLFVGVRQGHNRTALSKDDVQFADLRVYNKSMDAKDASRLSCFINDLPSDDVFSNSVMGSYKLDNVQGDLLKNDVAGKPNLKFTNTNISKTNKSLISTKCNQDDRGNILITNQDITTMILYWLRVTPEASWKMTGSKILDKFEAEFIKTTK